MIILNIYQKPPFDIIAMASRGTLGLFYVHFTQLMPHLVVYTLPFNL